MPDGSTKYELSDVSQGGVIWAGVGVAALIGLCSLGVWILMALSHRTLSHAESASRIANLHMVAPPPRLQVDEVEDIKQLRAAHEEELRTYGWVNREAGIIRIPIERAIELTASRGLPTRKPAEGAGKPEGAP